MKKLDLVRRMVTWSVELSEYNIQCVLKESIKSQALDNFVVELNSPIKEDPPSEWVLSVDNTSNIKGSSAGIMPGGLGDIVIE